nr:unnamed protein product [Callosobruchus chinensis]
MSNPNYSKNHEYWHKKRNQTENWYDSSQHDSRYRQNDRRPDGRSNQNSLQQDLWDRGGGGISSRDERRYGGHQRSSELYVGRGGRGFRGPSRGYSSRQSTPYDRLPNKSRYRDNESSEEINTTVLTALDVKVNNLINAVQSQHPVIGQIIFTQICNENPTVLLQNAMQGLRNCSVNVLQNQQSGLYELRINGDKFAEGQFLSHKLAKTNLFETVFNDLKDRCFFITKKRNYEEVTTGAIKKEKGNSNGPSSNNDLGENSKAYQMMLKMGWGGKGLGSQEQGEEKTVAELITENITKEGLGSKNVMEEIDRIMREFAHSTKLSTLAFDSSFTKEERARMHT